MRNTVLDTGIFAALTAVPDAEPELFFELFGVVVLPQAASSSVTAVVRSEQVRTDTC